jgi:hypothetical protein
MGSSSDLHYEPINVGKLHVFGIPIISTIDKCRRFVSIGHELSTFVYCKYYWDPKDVRSFSTLIGS